MRILTWNIRHGSTASNRTQLLGSIVGKDPDLIVLTEFRAGRMGALNDVLSERGLRHQHVGTSDPGLNTILLASGEEALLREETATRPRARHRWLEVYLPVRDVDVLGVHIPGARDEWDKEDFWQAVLGYARMRSGDRAVIVGDFNTGLADDAEGTPFALSERMEELISLGWVDAWRSRNPTRREYTWYSSAGNGFRLDYAFVSPPLAMRIKGARIFHEERSEGLSDHSSLLVELDI